MIKIYSPRIHNLGDFSHCFPTLSGLYKKFGHKFSFGICDRLMRFRGIKEFLLAQEMFEDVHFMHERPVEKDNYLVIDDTGPEGDYEQSAIVARKFHTFLTQTYGLDFEIDNEFELNIPKYNMDYFDDKIIVGDRWNSNDAPDVDTRRYSNLIESAEIIPKEKCYYLDYKNDLLYNCSLIKHNKNALITTFTGISVIADMMKKDFFILWDNDMENWQNWNVQHVYDLHYYKDRKSELVYIKDFDYKRAYK